jgi:cytochrome c-type biogenesis protein CcmE
MHPRRKKHLQWIVGALALLSLAIGLLLYALRNQADYYYDPSRIANGEAPQNKRIRAGGMVVAGSVKRAEEGLVTRFQITDYKATVNVEFTGILPALFKENSGVVGTGTIREGTFYASEILAKHDENYMPPEVAKSLKSQHLKVPAAAE